MRVTALLAAALLSIDGLGPETVVEADFDGDGVADVLRSARDGGSGYSGSEVCVEDGATGRAACAAEMTSAYGPFGAIRHIATAPPPGPALMALLPTVDCVAADRSDPRQGALWALARPAEGGTLRPPARPGPRPDPVRVCLEPAAAAVASTGPVEHRAPR